MKKVVPADDNSLKISGYLAWMDAIDRQTTVIAEIRHLQVNIIYTLRLGELYQPLRFEEDFLWGNAPVAGEEDGDGGWWEPITDVLGRFETTRDGKVINDLAHLARHWVIRYPVFGESRPGRGAVSDFATAHTDMTTREQIVANVRNKLVDVRGQGLWSPLARRNYDQLSVLQVIKGNILHQKLLLCCMGMRAFGGWTADRAAPISSEGMANRLAHFLIVRDSALIKLRELVRRVGDIQAQFERALDAAPDQSPRPVATRRRSQALYATFLAKRADALTATTEATLEELGVGPLNGRSPLRRRTMHRWHHDPACYAYRLVDNVGDLCSKSLTSKDLDGSRIPFREDIHFIDTAFWFPDRPDLQSIIAHEAAHNVLKDRYDDFSLTAISERDDNFSALVRRIFTVLEEFGIDQWSRVPGRLKAPSIVQEIIADLLGVITTGPAYLLPLFLETIGAETGNDFPEGLEYSHPDDMTVIDSTAARTERAREWYMRLSILCCWAKAIGPKDGNSPLAATLLGAIQDSADTILWYISRKWGEPHLGFVRETRAIAEAINDAVVTSPAVAEARELMKRRSQWRSVQEQFPNYIPSTPRHTHRLPLPVREFLLRLLLRKKTGQHRLLDTGSYRTITEVKARFDDLYRLAKTPSAASPEFIHPGSSYPLFRHLHDIPWECFVLRAVDFALQTLPSTGLAVPRLDGRRLIHQMCNQVELGRHLYQIGLEAHLWATQDTGNRLAAVVGALHEVAVDGVPGLGAWMKGTGTGDEEDLTKEIKDFATRRQKDELRWLRRYGFPRPEDKETFRHAESDRLLSQAAKDEISRLAGHYSAATLLKATARCAADESHRDSLALCLLQAVYAEKLAQLAPILRDTQQQLQPLLAFVEAGDLRKDEALKSLVTAFAARTDGTGYRQNNSFLVGSIALTANLDGSGAKSARRIVEKGNWTEPKGSCASDARHYTVILGGHDLFIINPTGPTCRCLLPKPPPRDDEAPSASPPSASQEEFLPFFKRREFAIAVRLNDEADIAARLSDGQPLAMATLAVTLTQTSTRLDLVYRLRRAIADATARKLKTGNTVIDDRLLTQWDVTLPEVGCLFSPRDLCLLTEGNDDVILLFADDDLSDRRDGEVDRCMALARIFAIQNALYQDFLVNRTELTLAPRHADVAFANPDVYEVYARVRLREGHDIVFNNHAFIDSMRPYEGSIKTFLQTPGPTDYVVVYDAHRDPGLTYLKHHDMYKGKWIEFMATTVGRKPFSGPGRPVTG